MTSTITYPLPRSDSEHERLMVQARLLRPWTDRFLRAGGLRPGMSVLDLGSGIGDVSLLAAEITGPQGSILGIDRDEAITDKARLRVVREGLADSVSFEVADLDEFRPDGRFDAVIGRYVLLYQEDPAAVLRHYARFLRPGGVVIFHDIDLTNAHPSWPACPAWDAPYQLFERAYQASGAAPDFGRRLASTYFAAGLPAPTVEAIIPVATGPESPLLDWIARSLRSLGPMLEKTGVSLPAGLDSGDLIEQWRKAITTDGVQLQGPVQYGAWTQIR